MREIIVDNFAGGGGASTGIEMATGRSVDIAINHDPNAIAMHTTNHPDTLHYCESVFDIDPVAATAGAPVGLAWFSPDCRQFGNSIGHPVDEPAGTVTAGGGGKSAVVSAFLAKHFGGNYTGPGAAMDTPAHTVTTTDHHALVTSNLVKMRGTNTGQKADEPLQTVTAGGNHFGEVRAFLMKYYGNEKGGVGLSDPLGTVTTNDRFGLVTVEGIDYQIVDIGMRMLQPHELYAAQGFPSWYVIDRDYRGVKYAKDKQVARCGNAVPPPFAEALVRANLPEMCSPLAKEKIA